MKYPVVLVIPVLMLLDYYLTLVAAILHERGYGEHMKIVQYELNPTWQASVKKRRWLNLRHLALVVLVTGIMLLVSEKVSAWPAKMLISAVVAVFAAVVGRHLSSVLTFRYVLKNPDDVRGTVSLSHRFVLRSSQNQVLILLCPFAAMLLFVRGPYTVGGVVGMTALFLVHNDWLKKHLKQRSPDESEPEKQSEDQANND